MKIYPNRVRTVLYFLIAILCLGLVVYLALSSWFLSPWGVGQIVVVSVYVLMTITLLSITIKGTFYIFHNSYFSFYRWGKETQYQYKDIIYINQEQGNLTATLEFYTSQGKLIYLTTDSGTELYDGVISRCKNLLTKEEFDKKFQSDQKRK